MRFDFQVSIEVDADHGDLRTNAYVEGQIVFTRIHSSFSGKGAHLTEAENAITDRIHNKIANALQLNYTSSDQ